MKHRPTTSTSTLSLNSPIIFMLSLVTPSYVTYEIYEGYMTNIHDKTVVFRL